MGTTISGATGIDKVQDGTIVNADINASAAIATSKLTGVLPLTGGTMTGGLSGTTAAFSSTITANGQAQLNNNNLIGLNTGATSEWIAKRTSSGEGVHILTTNASGADTQRLAITCNADTANFLIKASNVGIGETSPATPLHITGSSPAIRLEHTNDNGYAEIYTSAQSALIFDADPGNTDNGTPIVFKVDGTEHMRIDYEGSTTWGTWGYSNNSVYINVGGKRSILMGVDTTASTNRIRFANSNGYVGSIATSGSGTSYGTSSDYRLKENVVDMADATTRLKQLKPKRFNFKADDSLTLDGFLAHEVSSIVPEAVIGEKDATEMQCIDQSKLVPLLVKTIQELEARLTAGGL